MKSKPKSPIFSKHPSNKITSIASKNYLISRNVIKNKSVFEEVEERYLFQSELKPLSKIEDLNLENLIKNASKKKNESFLHLSSSYKESKQKPEPKKLKSQTRSLILDDSEIDIGHFEKDSSYNLKYETNFHNKIQQCLSKSIKTNKKSISKNQIQNSMYMSVDKKSRKSLYFADMEDEEEIMSVKSLRKMQNMVLLPKSENKFIKSEKKINIENKNSVFKKSSLPEKVKRIDLLMKQLSNETSLDKKDKIRIVENKTLDLLTQFQEILGNKKTIEVSIYEEFDNIKKLLLNLRESFQTNKILIKKIEGLEKFFKEVSLIRI